MEAQTVPHLSHSKELRLGVSTLRETNLTRSPGGSSGSRLRDAPPCGHPKQNGSGSEGRRGHRAPAEAERGRFSSVPGQQAGLGDREREGKAKAAALLSLRWALRPWDRKVSVICWRMRPPRLQSPIHPRAVRQTASAWWSTLLPLITPHPASALVFAFEFVFMYLAELPLQILMHLSEERSLICRSRATVGRG